MALYVNVLVILDIPNHEQHFFFFFNCDSTLLLEALSGNTTVSKWCFGVVLPKTCITWKNTVHTKHSRD